ncbi:MAG: imidazolonepropionase [Bacteroidota bacterium]|nr:MAG: imidazolonepropionase [Bacteroidota bacterium]
MNRTLYGPITQLLTMASLPDKGPIADAALEIIPDAALLVEGNRIVAVGMFAALKGAGDHIETTSPCVVMPGLIDTHTHLCFAGSRAGDYSARISGKTYQEILESGGGIMDTVQKTRACDGKMLVELLLQRLARHASEGVTTCEIKSGYGLSVEHELKILHAIGEAAELQPVSLVSTCLAAHITPPEFESPAMYLEHILAELLPIVSRESLAQRVDIFIEPSAFPAAIAASFLKRAMSMGFMATVHADQFTTGGSAVAIDVGAISADHLEASGDDDIKALAASSVTATVLPGASLGLGMHFAPARKILDYGCALVIASDWNPGSAPMGDLLMQASVLSAQQKLSNAETLSAVTFRAARALGLSDRGTLEAGKRADFIAFPVDDYREILYHQGKLKPSRVWIAGKEFSS